VSNENAGGSELTLKADLEHHDGFALFDFPTNISMRSSIHYGPQRDFIGELLATAKQYYPEIRRGKLF
jgi:alpha-L-fucosidase